MHVDAISPHPLLKPYISCYYHIRVSSGQFHFPADGCPGFIINLSEPFLLGFEDRQLDRLTGCRLFGSSTRALMTKHQSGRTELLAVKYRPGQLPRFFGIPAIEMTDTCVSLQAVCGAAGRQLEDKLCGNRNLTDIVRMLDQASIDCLPNEKNDDPRIFRALDTIVRQKGQVRIEALSADIGLSRRHFERRFQEIVGLTPKRMCRISRFLSVFKYLQENQVSDWASYAIENGYSDQAHLIRECKYFTGRSPLSYLNSRSSLERTILGERDEMSHLFNTTDGSSAILS